MGALWARARAADGKLKQYHGRVASLSEAQHAPAASPPADAIYATRACGVSARLLNARFSCLHGMGRVRFLLGS